MKVKALILSGDGINCEVETAKAFELAGAESTIVTLEDFLHKIDIHEYHIMAFPGGFSFGDEIRSGKILAELISLYKSEEIKKFIADNKPIIGICNGFQILTQLKIFGNEVSLCENTSHQFINKWVKLKLDVEQDSLWFRNLKETEFSMPIRHKEGNLQGDLSSCHPALNYHEDVNGSIDNLAAITNLAGNVLGLMPHPEAALHPFLFHENKDNYKFNRQLFSNAVDYVKETF